MANSMVTSDFESAHAFPVKPEIVGFSPLKGPTWIFLTLTYVSEPTEFKNDCFVLARPRTSGLNPEIIGFISFKGQKWFFFDSNLRKKIHWVQKW